MEEQGQEKEMEPGKKCPVCGGEIVEKFFWVEKYNPLFGPPLIGPGSKEQICRVEKRTDPYCRNCRIKFQLPLP